MKSGMRGVYQGVSFAKWVVRVVVLRVWETVCWRNRAVRSASFLIVPVWSG